MITGKNRAFSSKILLFGEYLLLCGSKALSIPYSKYSGQFEFSKEKNNHISNINLGKFLKYLKNITHSLNLDLLTFEKEIEKGLIFSSNIPHSYGLGSSGSLSAAVYDRYAINKIDKNTFADDEILSLKTIFSEMESFFHGRSSGLDPLISYLDAPVLVEKPNRLRKISLPLFTKGSSNVFFINLGVPGDTGPLVRHFMDNCEDVNFKEKIVTKVIPSNNKCIDLFLSGNIKETTECVKKLSIFTFELLYKMIPEEIVSLWEYGINNDEYYLKLCGSGGGGMMLGFTNNFDKTSTTLKKYNPEIIF